MDNNTEVFESIITGLNQAIQYEKGSLKNVRKRRVTISPIPHYEGQSVKKIRDRLHLSQNAFAQIIGVSKKTVEAWEAGRNVPQGPAQRIIDLMTKEKNFLEKYHIISIE